MEEKDVEKLQKIAKSLRKIGTKVKLISLLDKAKSEFDSIVPV